MDFELVKLLPVFGLGFVLGLKHALDADHVVAVTTIVSQTKNLKKSSLLGLAWGSGHTAVLLVVAVLVMVFKINIPENISMILEFVVGGLLVVLGLNVFRKINSENIHLHKHQHEGREHLHLHSHKKSLDHQHIHTSLIMGMIHGLAGSATLMLLVLATVTSLIGGIIYVLVFGIGSIVGMMIVSSLISMPFIFTKKLNKINLVIRYSAGLISIVLGVMIMYQISTTDGLLNF